MMKLMSLQQYMKLSKPALIRKITKALRVMPKAKLARLCYNITKSKLPRLRVRSIERAKRTSVFPHDELGYKIVADRRARKLRMKRLLDPPRKKRKFSRKQLAAQRLFAKRARAGTLKRRRR